MKTLKTLFLAGLALFAMSSFAWSGSTAPAGDRDASLSRFV